MGYRDLFVVHGRLGEGEMSVVRSTDADESELESDRTIPSMAYRSWEMDLVRDVQRDGPAAFGLVG